MGAHLLKKEGNVSFATMFANFTARVVWGEGANAGTFTLPEGFVLQSTTEEDFFLNLEAVRQQLPALVNAALPGYIEDEIDEKLVSEWVDANGTTDRLYCIYHGNRVIGFLYQNRMRCLTKMKNFVQAYGILPQYQGLGLGSAVLCRALKDQEAHCYILADIDGEHPGSLACFRRAAGVLNWRMDAIGRFNADKKKFELNRRPRVDEGTRWCLRFAGAPELFPG